MAKENTYAIDKIKKEDGSFISGPADLENVDVTMTVMNVENSLLSVGAKLASIVATGSISILTEISELDPDSVDKEDLNEMRKVAADNSDIISEGIKQGADVTELI